MQSKRLMAVFFAVALFIAGIAGPASAQQFGLVNVDVNNVANNLKIGAAIPVVVNACPNISANLVVAAILAVARGEQEEPITFTCTNGPVTISQAQ